MIQDNRTDQTVPARTRIEAAIAKLDAMGTLSDQLQRVRAELAAELEAIDES